MTLIKNNDLFEMCLMHQTSLYSFCHKKLSMDISGTLINLLWERFPCNHSYGCAHNVTTGRIVQTDSLIFPENSVFL